MVVLDSAGETLVLLRIVVLQSNLQLDSLLEATLFLLGLIKDCIYALEQDLLWYL